MSDDDLSAELFNRPEPPAEAEREARGREILRNHAIARDRRELARAADAWERMQDEIRKQAE